MPDAPRDLVENLIVQALTERLESALELAAQADAARRLAEIARLCEECAQIARAAALLLIDQT